MKQTRQTPELCWVINIRNRKREYRETEMKRISSLASRQGLLFILILALSFGTSQSQEEEKVHLRIITLRSSEEQEAVLSKLEAGASFPEMARRYSTDSTGQSGGYLGSIQLGHLSRSLREVVKSTDEGVLGRLYDAKLGYVIVLKLNSAQARVASAEESRQESIRLLRAGSNDEALEGLNRAVSLDPGATQTHLFLGWARRLAGTPYQIHQAQGSFEEAIRRDSASVWARIHLALLFIDLGQLERVEGVLEEAAKVLPDDSLLLALQGEVARRLGKRVQAEQFLALALRLSPSLLLARAYRGLLYLDSNRPTEAVAELEAALEDFPSESELHGRVAGIALRREDVALNAERPLFVLRPSYPEVLLALAGAQRLLGRPRDALETLSLLESFLNPLRGWVARPTLSIWVQQISYQRGLSFEALDLPAEAIRLYYQGFKVTPLHGPSHRRLSELIFSGGFYPEALTHATHAEAFGAPMEDSSIGKFLQSLSPLQAGPEGDVRSPGPARLLQSSLNEYHGRMRIPLLERLLHLLQGLGASLSQRAALNRNLGQEFLQQGKIAAAIEHLELALTQSKEPSKVAQLYFERGIAYLRRSEVQNCVAGHNAESCLFPLRGGGLHRIRAAAESAWQSFEKYLELEPDSLRGRWFLNLTAMALGTYPDSVAPAHRIPPTVLESEYSVGRFPDIAPELGLDTFNLCGGSIVDDFDNDGWLDIITSTSDPEGPITYYRNTGTGGTGAFEDVSTSSRIDQHFGGLNSIGADYDNDGDVDVLVLRGAWWFEQGRMTNSLLRNNIDRGDATFTDVTEAAGLSEPALPTQAAAWGDIDNDGDLDLYIGNESRSEDPTSPHAYPAQLFRNHGNGTFTDVALSAGVANFRYTKGAALGDFDNDGDLDLYVSNVGPNRLYRNEGDGTFVDVAAELGVEEPAGRSFAAWFFDYDNDGWLDLFVSAYDASIADVTRDTLGLTHQAIRPRLYRNVAGKFVDVSIQAGLDHAYLPMGANFGDLDHDGYLDIYLGTGDPDFQTLMPNVMLRNDRGARFQDVTTSGGFGHLQKGHGISFADLDNDGDQDIYHQLGGFYPGDRYGNAFFHNPGHGSRFLYLKLAGTESNRAGAGARIRLLVETRENPKGMREIHRAVGAVSSFGGSPLRQEIGLGRASKIRKLEVWWPASGRRQSFEDVPMDRLILVRESSQEFEVLPLVAIVFGDK